MLYIDAIIRPQKEVLRMDIYDERNYGPIREGVFERHIDDLTKLKNAILQANGDGIYIKLNELYDYAKVIAPAFCFDDDPIRVNYACVADFINNTEKLIPPEFIMNPAITTNRSFKCSRESEPEEIAEYIATMTRVQLCKRLTQTENLSLITMLDLEDNCSFAAFTAASLAEYLGLKAKVRVLNPGFSTDACLYNGGDHAFALIIIDNRIFLIDCTYSQFFINSRCQIQKNGIMLSRNCQPGFFMTLTPARRKVAEKILRDGWIELKNDELKHYIDGFTLSYRNGLFYERSEDFSFTTPYDVNTCWDFISYEKDLLDFEDDETLGYQYTPLKNPRMRFDKY